MEDKDLDKLSKYAVLLAVVETSLGSLLHSFKIPFSGHSLSLNQGFILTHSSKNIENKFYANYISTVVSLLKTLSPAGKKLTPMLAILTQGFLYNLGTLILGRNFWGQSLGMILLTSWAFIQPVLIYTIIFGRDLYFMLQYFMSKLEKVFSLNQDDILFFLSLVIMTKYFIGIVLVILARKLSFSQISKLNSQINERLKGIKKEKKTYKKNLGPLRGATKDLFHPLFLVTLSLSTIFYYFSNSDHVQLIWLTLRPIAIAWLLFFILRIFPIEIVSDKLLRGKTKEIFNLTLIRLRK